MPHPSPEPARLIDDPERLRRHLTDLAMGALSSARAGGLMLSSIEERLVRSLMTDTMACVAHRIALEHAEASAPARAA